MDKGLIFTYALTYGGALASILNPFIGLLIYVCFAIVKPEAMWYWSVPEGNYSRIVAIALLVGWVTRVFGSWRFGRAGLVVYALLGYVAWSAFGVVMAAEQRVAIIFIEALLKIALPFIVGITLIRDLRQLKQLAWVIVLSQGYVAYELNLSYYEGVNRITTIGFAGMDNNSVAIAMVTGVGAGFFLGLHAERWWLKLIAFAATALMGHAILFSMSRGGMIALVVTAAVSFLIIPKQPRHYVTFAIGVLLMLRLAGDEVRDRFMTSFRDDEHRDVSAQSRLELWTGCWDAMLKRPILGIGPNNWPLIVNEYGWPIGKEAHSLWLQQGAEQGFPGLALLLTFYLGCMVRLWPLTRERTPVPDPWLRGMARMVVAALTGFVVSAQFVSLEGLELPFFVVLIGAGVLKLCSVAPAQAAPAAQALPFNGWHSQVPVEDGRRVMHSPFYMRQSGKKS